jgi:hypothetical protein
MTTVLQVITAAIEAATATIVLVAAARRTRRGPKR